MGSNKFKEKRIVIVRWRDATTSAGWYEPDDVPGVEDCISVGWLVSYDKDSLKLAITTDSEQAECCSTGAIPRKMIQEVSEVIGMHLEPYPPKKKGAEDGEDDGSKE